MRKILGAQKTLGSKLKEKEAEVEKAKRAVAIRVGGLVTRMLQQRDKFNQDLRAAGNQR